MSSLFRRREAIAAIVLLRALPTRAQSPRTMRIIVPYTAGGGSDQTARAFADALERRGRPAIVDNRAGAGTVIGAMEVKRAAPDGLTVLFTTTSTLMQLPHLRKDLPYDPFKDFTYITDACRNPQPLMASMELPCTTLAELIAYVRANPGKVSYATVATGGSGHINMEAFRLSQGLDMVQVPYKGTTDALKDLLPGRVQLMLDNAPAYPEFVRQGKLRALAVTGTKRMHTMPMVPTFQESGANTLGIIGGFAFYGPSNMPRDVLQALFLDLTKAAQDKKVLEVIEAQSAESTPSASPEAFLVASKAEFETWGTAIRRANIKIE
jgi:tripartite-type tricarboxylate transporter receptor subunit TctC